MKNIVWKFEIENRGIHQDDIIWLPPSAKIVAFGYQKHPTTRDTGWFLWAVVDPDEPTEKRRFIVVATGQDWMAKDLDHVMTSKEADGFMWHLLEWRRP